MIKKGEIQKIASQLELRDTQIEKDYVNSWVLKGINQNQYLNHHLIFKGGTLLRKVYYPEYRLSEDLDFTFQGKEFDIKKTREEFHNVFEWVYSASRIKLDMEDETEHETGNLNFYISYTGPLGGIGIHKNIKVDISSTEIIINQPEESLITNVYSDLQEEQKILAYKQNELIPEKMRSLIQRTEPRDLYDLWYMFEVDNLNIEEYIYTFQDKAIHKGYIPDQFAEKVLEKEQIFKKLWEKHLAYQLKNPAAFEDVWRDLGKHWRRFDKFFSKNVKNNKRKS